MTRTTSLRLLCTVALLLLVGCGKRAEQASSENPGPQVGARGIGDPEPTAAPTPVRGANLGSKFAILVGVQEYKSKELPDLRYTGADVEELARVLRQAGYPAEQVVLLTSGQGAPPTADRIRAELDRVLALCTPDDLVLIAFAGHGIQPAGTKDFYFCPVGTKLDDKKTLVPLNEVYRKLESCKAGFKLLLADACRNDPGARGVRPVENLASVTRPQEVRVPGELMAFYSCSPGQFAYEPEELKHGVFFHFLIEGLKGEADLDADGHIIREELELFVKKRVRTYTVDRMKREQWPHFQGESNDQRPIVSLPRKPAGSAVVVATPRPTKRDERLLVHEDFQSLREGTTLPRGWNGRGLFAVRKPADGPPYLRTTANAGFIPLTLPDTPLHGDFFVECEINLQHPNVGHTFQVRLEGLGVGVPVQFSDWERHVVIADKPAERVESISRGQATRLLIVREGADYRVSVNNSVVQVTQLPYRGNFDRIHLDVTALPNKGAPVFLHSLKAGLLPQLNPADRPVAARTGKVLLDEDFTAVEQEGELPPGWKSEDVSVQKDAGGRRCLTAQPAKKMPLISLPPLPLAGDFFVECEFALQHPTMGNQLQVILEGKGIQVPITVDGWRYTLAIANLEPKVIKPLMNGEGFNRLRLTRRAGVYRVELNDGYVLAQRLPAQGAFEQVHLGLTAVKNYSPTLAYSVRVGTLDPAKGEAAPAAVSP